MLRVGLTGGIACGRSTVGAFLKERGILVLDADDVAHALLCEGGGAVGEVAAAFGPGVLRPGGGVDRTSLARVVFADAGARRTLEAILHPRILEVLDADVRAFESRRGEGIVVVDAALMVETGTYTRYHRLAVAHCKPEVQLRRLRLRSGLGSEEAAARVAAQAPLASKVAVADYLIDTGGSLDETKENTLRVVPLLEEDLRSLPLLKLRPRGEAAC